MRVKSRLQLSAALLLIAVAVVFLVIVLAMYRVNQAIEASNTAGEIIIGAFERLTLRNDYVQNGNERARVQWAYKHEQLGRYLTTAAEKFHDPTNQKIVAEMIEDQESIGRLFSSIVKNREKRKGTAQADALTMETEERLLTQLNKRIYELVSRARSLRESSGETLFSNLRLAGWRIACVLILVMAAVILNSWTMGRSIAARIQCLRDSAVTIGGGTSITGSTLRARMSLRNCQGPSMP
jgi:hypothetical protein